LLLALLGVVGKIVGECAPQLPRPSRGKAEDRNLEQIVADHVDEVAAPDDARSRGNMSRHLVVRRFAQVEVAKPAELKGRQALGAGDALFHGWPIPGPDFPGPRGFLCASPGAR
jgi:hypothetical protein